MSGRQWAFWRGALQSLRDQLGNLGQPLIVRHGDVIAAPRQLLREHEVSAVWSHQETGNAWPFARHRAVAAFLRDAGVPWWEVRQHGVVRGRCDRDR
jgi:deoxyribodipyrimidine photo-lyase